jgi:hypothetical protein
MDTRYVRVHTIKENWYTVIVAYMPMESDPGPILYNTKVFPLITNNGVGPECIVHIGDCLLNKIISDEGFYFNGVFYYLKPSEPRRKSIVVNGENYDIV